MIFSDEEYRGMSCVNDASIERNEKDPHTSCTGILLWVSDETRTRDSQDHNLVLYQLNYIHHRRRKPGRQRRVSEPSTL